MSEKVTVTVRSGQEEQQIIHAAAKNLLETLQNHNLAEGSFCKGLSLCGHCKVRFEKGAPFPSARDRQVFTAEELRQGFRLACQAKPRQDCVVKLQFAVEDGMEMIAGSCLPEETEKSRKGDKQPETNPCRKAEKTPENRRTFAAVDIGTTTVVMQLADAETGAVLQTVKFMNPQRCFGFDVLSRIQAAAGHGEQMREQIVQAVMQGMRKLQNAAECKRQPELLCVTGNTAMLHIFLGYDTAGLGKSPFRPVSLQGEELIVEGLRTVVMPSLSAFVGADVAAGILQTGMQESAQIKLLLDLGTNGEMVLGNREKMVACATAAGPAFEGGTKQGIYGADIIGAIAKLLNEGSIEENGYVERTRVCRYREKEVEIALEKIREIQLAKAAVRTGIEVMMKKYGELSYDAIETVYLAGGFGFFLEPSAAVRIGLLPKELEQKAKPVGNSALAGALTFGRAYLEDAAKAKEMWNTDAIEAFNLAEETEFQELYIENMNFPE